MTSQSLPYYLLRIVRLWSLLMTGMLTLLLYVVLIVIVANTSYSQAANLHYSNVQSLFDTNSRAFNVLSAMAIGSAIVSLAITGLSVLNKSTRQLEKRVLIDCVVVIVFCIIGILFSQIIVKGFISRYLVNIQ
jgi:hypothetical protein